MTKSDRLTDTKLKVIRRFRNLNNYEEKKHRSNKHNTSIIYRYNRKYYSEYFFTFLSRRNETYRIWSRKIKSCWHSIFSHFNRNHPFRIKFLEGPTKLWEIWEKKKIGNRESISPNDTYFMFYDNLYINQNSHENVMNTIDHGEMLVMLHIIYYIKCTNLTYFFRIAFRSIQY